MSEKNSILGLSGTKKPNFLIFYTHEHLQFTLNSVEHEKSFIISGPGFVSFTEWAFPNYFNVSLLNVNECTFKEAISHFGLNIFYFE